LVKSCLTGTGCAGTLPLNPAITRANASTARAGPVNTARVRLVCLFIGCIQLHKLSFAQFRGHDVYLARQGGA
jgi:hypothetical protein